MNNLQKNHKKFSTSTMAVVALMTAVLCVLAPFSIPVGVIPISLATLGLYLAAIILGSKKATVACLLYLLIGFVGLPVYSGFVGGPAKLLGPTGGYLCGYLLLTYITGWFVDKFPGKWKLCLLGMVLGTTACYFMGTIWLAFQVKIGLSEAVMVGVVPFIIGDIIKIVIAMWIGVTTRKAIVRASIAGSC